MSTSTSFEAMEAADQAFRATADCEGHMVVYDNLELDLEAVERFRQATSSQEGFEGPHSLRLGELGHFVVYASKNVGKLTPSSFMFIGEMLTKKDTKARLVVHDRRPKTKLADRLLRRKPKVEAVLVTLIPMRQRAVANQRER